MEHLSLNEIYKYDNMYSNHPDYGQVDVNEPRFQTTLAYLQAIDGAVTILDAGVGRGGFYNLVKDNYDVYGIEPSKVAIEKFHKNDSRIANAFIQDIPNYFNEATFDVVACLDVLEHIPPDDIDLVLGAMAACGKKYFIFSIATHKDIIDDMELHVSIFRYEDWAKKLGAYFDIISSISIHNDLARVYLLEKINCNDDNLVFNPIKNMQLEESLERNFSTDSNSDKIKEFEKTFIQDLMQNENFSTWQNAFQNGYKSSMGDHSTYFYNKNLSRMGLYDLINNANTIIEYGAADAVFMKKFIDKYPAKNFIITEYSTELVHKLKNKFSVYNNVEVMINYPEISSLSNIDLSFSFLLSQSMPRSLWKQHLKNVRSMLSEKGSYIFQFAYHPNGFADDQIQNGIYGNNKYKPEEITKILEEVGYKGCDLSDPITLESLNSDIIWYLCKADK